LSHGDFGIELDISFRGEFSHWLKNMDENFLSSFPPPPQYYHEYEYLDTAPKPPPPIEGNFQTFGIPQPLSDEIKRPRDENVRELFPDNFNHVHELKKMNHSLQESFAELLDILENYSTEKIDDTFAWKVKCDEIQLLFINMSYILNSYRPHQARQQIITILQHQLAKRKDAIQKLVQIHDIQLSTKSSKRKFQDLPVSQPKLEKMEIVEVEPNYDDLYSKYPF
jgi:hypothetical protein